MQEGSVLVYIKYMNIFYLCIYKFYLFVDSCIVQALEILYWTLFQSKINFHPVNYSPISLALSFKVFLRLKFQVKDLLKAEDLLP